MPNSFTGRSVGSRSCGGTDGVAGSEGIDAHAERLLQQLSMHEERRRHSRPLVSVLVGPEGLAISLWRRWCVARQATAVLLREPSLNALCQLLSMHLFTEKQVWNAALVRVTERLESPERLRERLPSMTAHELELLCFRAGLEPASNPQDRLALALLDLVRCGDPLTAQGLQSRLLNTSACGETQPLTFISALQRLLPPAKVAVLALCDASREEPVVALDRWARFLAHVSSAVPELPLGLAVSEAAYSAHDSGCPDSFHKAVLRDSAIRLPSPDARSVRRAIESHVGFGRAKVSAVAEALADCGGSRELLQAFADAASATSDVSENPEEGERARSAAEAFLYDLLEHLPETAGRFQLNLVEAFHFGGRPAEIDLASRKLAIAIEIDGHYHFTDSSRYRRDRRKDFLLQRHGYLVLRFLAQDVVQEMFHVRDVILEAVRLRVSSLEAKNHGG